GRITRSTDGSRAPEAELSLARARGPRARPPGRGTTVGGAGRAPTGRHRRVVRRLTGGARGGSERPRPRVGPAVRALPDRARGSSGARGRRARAPFKGASPATGDALDRHRSPVPLSGGACRV